MVTLLLTVLAADPTWKPETTSDGITLTSRTVEGSDSYEYRAQTEVVEPTAALCDAIFEYASNGKGSPETKVRKLLEDKGDWRLIHDEIEAPIVSKRVLTFSVARRKAADGTCVVEAKAENDKGPKTPEGSVRIEKMRTFWHFVPAGEKTRITFTLFAEPGGSVPTFLIRGAQRDAAMNSIKRGLANAKTARAK